MLKNRKSTTVYIPAFSAHGYAGLRWVHRPDDSLRRVGYADELADRIDHKGWYVDDSAGEVYRGVVYQLPADRDGACRYVPGYQDPWSDAVIMAFGDLCDDKHEAAYVADRMAEIFAEHERDYQEAAHAAFQVMYLRADISDLRTRTRHLRSMIRASKRPTPERRTLQACLDGARSQIAELVRKGSELVSQFGTHPGFTDNI